MIIYELESDYAHYLEALGAPQRLVRKYAFRNAMLPQITGLALALGAILGGALVTEIVFSYPGPRLPDLPRDHERGLLRDPGHLPVHHHRRPLANFIVDIVYVVVDPRTRIGMEGGRSMSATPRPLASACGPAQAEC